MPPKKKQKTEAGALSTVHKVFLELGSSFWEVQVLEAANKTACVCTRFGSIVASSSAGCALTSSTRPKSPENELCTTAPPPLHRSSVSRPVHTGAPDDRTVPPHREMPMHDTYMYPFCCERAMHQKHEGGDGMSHLAQHITVSDYRREILVLQSQTPY